MSGGPAFPYFNPDTEVVYPGMSLRDWYMGQARASWSETHHRLVGVCRYGPQEMARVCAQIADAVLAARKDNA